MMVVFGTIKCGCKRYIRMYPLYVCIIYCSYVICAVSCTYVHVALCTYISCVANIMYMNMIIGDTHKRSIGKKPPSIQAKCAVINKYSRYVRTYVILMHYTIRFF